MPVLQPLSAVKTPLSHEDLLVAVGAKRDREAFVALFRHYAPRIKSWLMKQGADDTAAEEVAQSTLVTVWEKAASFDPKKARASTWIYTIARNRRIDMLRKERFSTVDPDDPVLGTLEQPQADAYAGPAETERLAAASSALAKDQAEMLHMAFFEDKSHSAIADEKRLPLGTVKSRIRLALDKLRHSVREDLR